MPNEKSRDYKAFLKPGVHEVPKVGDTCIVTGVYPGTTNPLFEPAIEVTFRLLNKPVDKPDAKDGEK